MLDENPDFIFGPRITDEVAALDAKGGVRFLHGSLQMLQGGQRRLRLYPQILQRLRILVHGFGQVGQPCALLLHNPQHLQGTEDTVARGGVVGKDKMAGILAAKGIAAAAQGLDDMAVADRGGQDLDAGLAHGLVQTEVTHHGARHGGPAERAFRLHG